jgi:hypothetical protein
MARITKTLASPPPSPGAAAAGGRGTTDRRRRGAVKRRLGDRRTNAMEGRRQEVKPAGKRAAEPRVLLGERDSPTLTDEERIESAKYLPRHVPPRVFEEERFLFPETYGVDRVRLLVKDPEWIFAYWDLSTTSVDSLRRELGERGMALTRLTLRITDPGHGGTSVILLPYGARAWYVRADAAPRSYRAQLGWTLPSGQFRMLAESNLVATPRTGPSPEIANRRLRWNAPADEIRAAAGAPADARLAPWLTEPIDADERARAARKRARGGASDVFRR